MRITAYIFVIICFTYINFLYSQNVDLPGQLNPYPKPDYSDIRDYSADGEEHALFTYFDATGLPSGIYSAKLNSGNNFKTIKMSSI